jgi:PadR family transcriptional regulator, regulatory protein AphA
VPELTTTSYAILSLLGVRSWTTYQLAQQMERSVGGMWPRAASVVYEEPKRLERVGLAESSTVYTGKRASTVYTITDDGRAALADWLERSGAGPTLEFEALLKVAFADNGSIDALRTNLAGIREYAGAEQIAISDRLREYASGGPYPERLPVIALAIRFFVEFNEAITRWVDWAEEATAHWTGTTIADGADVPSDAFGPVPVERRGNGTRHCF